MGCPARARLHGCQGRASDLQASLREAIGAALSVRRASGSKRRDSLARPLRAGVTREQDLKGSTVLYLTDPVAGLIARPFRESGSYEALTGRRESIASASEGFSIPCLSSAAGAARGQHATLTRCARIGQPFDAKAELAVDVYHAPECTSWIYCHSPEVALNYHTSDANVAVADDGSPDGATPCAASGTARSVGTRGNHNAQWRSDI